MINLIDSRCSTHGLLLCFISLHISNSSVSASLVEHVFYSADLMSAIYFPYFYFMIYEYIYSRYSSVFLTLYQLYYSLPFSTLISSSSFYLKLQPKLFLKVVTALGVYHKHVEQEQNNPEWNRVILRKKEINNKIGKQPWPQLMCCASICCHMWLHISGGQNCCQEFRKEMVYRLMKGRIKHIRDINL